MGPIGAQEMFLIFVLALLLFGPKKLPELGRLLGKGLTEFRRAKNELKTTFESHMQELEKEVKLTEKPDTSHWDHSSNSQYSSASYPYTYDEHGHQDSSHEAVTGSDAIAELPGAEVHNAEPQAAEPVAGTVPRSRTSETHEPVSTATEENHPA